MYISVSFCKHPYERYGCDQNIIACVMYHISHKYYLYVYICIQKRPFVLYDRYGGVQNIITCVMYHISIMLIYVYEYIIV